MRISSTLLKKGAEAGLTLAQIGQILCRPDDDEEQPGIEISFMLSEPLGLNISPDDLAITGIVSGSQAECYGVPPGELDLSAASGRDLWSSGK